MTFLANTPKSIAIKLTPTAERLVKKGHPWVYSDSILKASKEGETGDVCVLFDAKDNALYAVGLFDKNSPIRIKIINRGAAKINEAFFTQRIGEALAKRQPLINSTTNSFRLLYGENDFLPGIIADVYTKVLVLKLYTSAWLPYLEDLKKAIIAVTKVKTIVMRCSRNVLKEIGNDSLDGAIVYGELLDEEIIFMEHGVHFSANVVKGHKTGFFLDHRHNRKRVGALSKGKTVLDVFAYAGGFSIHALVGGARKVTSVDISAHALEMATKNAALNTFKGEHENVVGDAFAILKKYQAENKKFDVVVIDPPSFAKSKEEIKTAVYKYTELAKLGAQLVQKNGILVLASCSSRVSEEEFLESHQQAFRMTGNHFKQIEVTRHDIDHPIAFAEGAYLKCAYYLKS